MKSWTRQAEERLIELWQESACLYDISDADYHNREEKDRRWREVADALQMPGEFYLSVCVCVCVCVQRERSLE